MFFLDKRFEVGVSFSRVLGNDRYNMIGMDVTWNLKKIPLDLRAEAIQSATLGKGYWVEGGVPS